MVWNFTRNIQEWDSHTGFQDAQLFSQLQGRTQIGKRVHRQTRVVVLCSTSRQREGHSRRWEGRRRREPEKEEGASIAHM